MPKKIFKLLCICGHHRFDHYGEKNRHACIHRMGRYDGIKCKCPGFSSDNLEYLEKKYAVKQGTKDLFNR